MEKFCVNKNEQEDSGDHEVHRSCKRLPKPENQEYLGEHPDSFSAIKKAQELHPTWRINGCYWCCPESHTS